MPDSWNREMLEKQLLKLSQQLSLWVNDDYSFVIVGGIKLPPGYNRGLTQLLIEIPQDYPLSPPGIGKSRLFVNRDLTFRGQELADLHKSRPPKFETPGFGPWAWWCYETIKWNPLRDTLSTLVGMVRADLTDPPTK